MSMMNHLIRPGDNVIMNMDSEARSWGRDGPPNGTLGVVLHCQRYQRHESRWGNSLHFRKPGLYESNGAALIQWEGIEKPETASSYDTDFVDKAAYDARYQTEWVNSPIENIILRGDALDNMVKISELPDTPFWEGDIVCDIRRSLVDADCYAVVNSIDYDFKFADGTSENFYRLSYYERNTHKSAYGSGAQESAIELVSRGNVWKEAHGEPLVFRDLADEAAFAVQMARTEQVRNPASKNFAWTKGEILAAMGAGTVHAMRGSNGFFGSGFSVYAENFQDDDLGRRVREETLKGFS